MASKRLFVGFLSLALALMAGSAQALDYSLTGGGGQSHIGNGLMLPVQSAATAATGMLVFPGDVANGRALLVPVRTGPAPIVTGTVLKPLQVVGPKSGYQRKLFVPAGVLSKPAAQTTVGVKISNPSVYAVGTNLTYTWPNAPSYFSTGQLVGSPNPVTFGASGSITYSNTLAARFGGTAQFGVVPNSVPAGLLTPTPVTVYLKISAVTAPCVGCFPIGVVGAFPTATGGVIDVGGNAATTIMTPGIPLAPNLALLNMGAVPLGTIIPPLRLSSERVASLPTWRPADRGRGRRVRSSSRPPVPGARLRNSLSRARTCEPAPAGGPSGWSRVPSASEPHRVPTRTAAGSSCN